MTEGEINGIEVALGKKLPLSYKNILLNFPPDLNEPINDDEPISAVLLPYDAKEIISSNLWHEKDLRNTTKIIIGSDGCGNEFLIDTVDQKIYEIDHENCKYFDEEQTKFDFLGSLVMRHENLNDYIEFWKKVKKGEE